MKHLIVWLCVMAPVAYAQNNISQAEYFFDTNPGFGQGIPITGWTPSTDATINFTADLTSVSSGLHILFVRAKNDSGWTLTYSKTFLKEAVSVSANITKAEYFFDSDPGFGQGSDISVSAAPDTTQSFTADLSGLTNGLHILFVRVRDINGNWSLSYSKSFLKEAVSASANIVQAEYFFDTNPGFGSGTNIPISASTDITQSFTADLTGLTNGLHILFVRALDVNGGWSLSYSKTFLKEAVSVSANIVKAEYFFDTDPGFNNGTNISISSVPDLTQNFTADLSGLSNGLHIIFVRTRDVNGVWSLSFTKPFIKEADPSANISSLEYYFRKSGVNSQVQTYSSFAPSNDVTVMLCPDLSNLSIDSTYKLFIYGKDASGMRSAQYIHSFTVDSSTILNVTPYVQRPISDWTLNEDFDSVIVANLDSIFNDSNLFLCGDSLRYSAATDNANVTALIHNNSLKLYSAANLNGSTRLIITTTDDSGAVARDTFMVTVNPVPDPVSRIHALRDTTLAEDFGTSFLYKLSPAFDNLDNAAMSFSGSHLSAGITALISNDTLKLNSVLNFNGTVAVRVTAGNGTFSAADTFNISVSPVNDPPAVFAAIRDTSQPFHFPKAFIVYLPTRFSDVDNGSLTYSVLSLSGGVNGVIANDSLYVTSTFGFFGGSVSLRVTASDNSLSVADTFVVNVTGSPVPLNLAASVHQNPALSKYADVFVIADTSLISTPVVKLFILPDSIPIAMSLLTGRTYKGEIQFSKDGTYEIRSQATASTGAYRSTTHSFSVSLAKPGVESSLASVDGYARLLIGKSAVAAQTYFLAEQESYNTETLYRFGPVADYKQSMEVYLRYDENVYPDAGKLFIAQFRDGKWFSLESRVNTVTKEVRTRTQTLGQFKILYDPNFTGSNIIPIEFALNQNYPNPFNPATSIVYDMPRDGEITLTIYNILGQKVRTLVQGFKPAGRYSIQWNGKNEKGIQTASGIYLYRMQTKEFVRTRKMTLIK